MDGLLSKIKNLDAYPKVNEDFFQRTLSGGIITIGSSLIMLALFVLELNFFLTLNTVNELSVDTSRGEKLRINVDVTFPALPCEWISLDVMDISGDLHLDVDHDIYKRRLTSAGVPIDEGDKHKIGPEDNLLVPKGANETEPECGSCYGAETAEVPCCNDCDAVRSAYRRRGWAFTDPQGIAQCAREGFVEKLQAQKGEGCHMWGFLEVNKVAGNFHFAPGKSFQQGNMHVHDLVPFGTTEFDLSHTVHKLSFGEEYPGMKNPLDGVTVQQVSNINPTGATGMYQYFLKVVPTIYTDIRNKTISSNQFSVTEHFKASDIAAGHNLPGVFFFYDLSPIKVRYSEQRSSFIEFLTSVCAIVGGVFTVSGLIDSFIYHGHQAIKKKIDLGKLS
ncbi:hypothetical protein WJX72_006989 [[Myrmecia] bisecta]|uniref:Endoplasmic reticulum-Golgi intermediate compartment protein 3 n=1 Tax=[Myrmecia] bisecta TaxID=41462 RepID=A0AAW1PHR9_9CHLO